MDNAKFDEFAQRLAEFIPGPARELQQDFEKNLRAGLHSAFQKMDLVTREEFDLQASLLARTREKLDAMEARLQTLEEKVASYHGGPAGEASHAQV